MVSEDSVALQVSNMKCVSLSHFPCISGSSVDERSRAFEEVAVDDDNETGFLEIFRAPRSGFHGYILQCYRYKWVEYVRRLNPLDDCN